MGYYFVGIIGAPVLMWAVCLGCGLAVERLLRLRLTNALVPVLGLCAAFVLIMPGYTAGLGDVLAVALLLAFSITGLLFAGGGLRTRLNPGSAGLAGLAVYAIYLLPVIAYGHWTWSGYDFVNDSAFEMLLANHAKGFGTVLGNLPESTERQYLAQYLNASGYPLGTQALLGTFSGMIDTPVEVLYQPFISCLAALAAVALSTIAELRVAPRRAALIAIAAICANLTYQYALQGAIKEIGLLAAILGLVALTCAAISLRRPYAGAALVAVGAAAALATYNAVAAPYLGALVLFLGLALMLIGHTLPHPRWIGPLVVGGALAGLLAIPSLTTFATFFEVAKAGQGAVGVGASQLGQLLRKLPLSQLSGVWLSGEYRLAIAPGTKATVTAVVSAAVLVLMATALLSAVRRRDPGTLMLLGVMGLVLLIVFPRVSPYAQGKLLAIASPVAVFAALMALVSVRGQWSVPALAVGGAIVIAILASDVMAYGHDRIAPTRRMEAMTEVGDRFAGKGPVLWNEFDEFAKYFARRSRISAPFEAITPQQVQLREPTSFYGRYFDLDEELLSFVESDPIVVTRRSPAASRPPANFRRVYENAYYVGWERASAPDVLAHLPEQQSYYAPSGIISCSALAPIVAGAPVATELIVAKAPELALFKPDQDPRRPTGWSTDPNSPGAVLTKTPGHSEGVVKVRGGARYAVWVQGDFPRKISVEIDGRRVGWVAGSNSPGQWLMAASLYLTPGGHRVRVLMTGGHRHLGPGEWPVGDVGAIGAVGLQREAPERLRTVTLSSYRTLCGQEADWVELVRP